MCCIVLDLEWNQPFSMRSMITTPVRLHGEIIQIGAVKLNEQLEIVVTFKVMVKPIHASKDIPTHSDIECGSCVRLSV